MTNYRSPRIPAYLLLFSGLIAPLANAETWTDVTGNFSIEAKFLGVEGQAIILLKENGQKITVPINRLSKESFEQGKALYRKMMQQLDQPSAGENPSTAVAQRDLAFTPPQPPAVSPMPPFPEGMTLEETVDFVKQQFQAGHPEVFWYALPEEMRNTLDDPKLRGSVNPFIKKQSATVNSIETLVFKGIQVLVTKKDFMLNSSMFAEMPAEAQPLVSQGYDPAVGMLYELADLGFRMTNLENQSIQSIVDHFGPRLGGHMKQLMPLVPQDQLDLWVGDLKVEMVDENNGLIKGPDTQEFIEDGFAVTIESDDLEMTRYAGRWIPKDLVDQWPALQQMAKSDVGAVLEQQQNSAEMQGAMMMVGMMTGVVAQSLDALLAASTQDEFDQALMQSSGMLNLGGDEEFEEAEMKFTDLPPTDAEEAEFVGEAPEGWTMDLSSVEIPTEEAAGVAGGRQMKINFASLQGGILRLAEKEKFNEKTAFIIFTFLDEGESIEGKTFEINPKSGFGSPHVHFRFTVDNDQDTEVYTDGYAMHLEFGEAADGKIPGKIYLCLNDPYRSLVAGEFVAEYQE